MNVEVVTLATNHLFDGNPLAEHHRLRYRAISQRQDWDVPNVNEMEYDQYDTPATVYLVWRDSMGIARGTTRLCTTDRPYMLQDHFRHMVSNRPMPKCKEIVEASRFCIDNRLPVAERERVARDLVLAYLEHGVGEKIKGIVGVMYPIYWKNLFIKNGCSMEWLGEVTITPDGKKSRAGMLPVSMAMLNNVRNVTGIKNSVTYYGADNFVGASCAA